MLDQFEAKWRRRLANDGTKGIDSRGYQSGYDGLKLFDGLEFVIAGGALYYDVQNQLLDMARRKEINSKPKRSVSVVQVNGYPPVPLCSVCAGLIRELRAPQAKEAKEAQAPPMEQVPEQATVEAPPQVVSVVQAAPPEPEVTDASPQLAEIIKKIGPATTEAPKMRSLHEHRAKEDWDDLMAKEAAKGE
jgi:hypothetical protein